jgi:hypothetical protein
MENKVSLPTPPVPLSAWMSLLMEHRLDFNELKPLEDLGGHEGDSTRVLEAIGGKYVFKDHPIYLDQSTLVGYKLPSFLLTRDWNKHTEGHRFTLLANCIGSAPWVDFIVVQWMATERGRDLLQDAMCNTAHAAGVPMDARFARRFAWKDLNEGEGWPRTVARLDFLTSVQGQAYKDVTYSVQLRFHDERGGLLFRNSEVFESLNLLTEEGIDTLFLNEALKLYPST